MQLFDYNHSYDPPAPFVKIVIDGRTGKTTEAIWAFVDSGADTTIVPRSLLTKLKARPRQQATIRSHWGEGRVVGLYLVDIRIGDIEVFAVEVVGDPKSEEIILGRNLLNQLKVVLDGLGEAVEIHSYDE